MKFAWLISNKICLNWDSAYQIISCVQIWSEAFGPDCKEKGLKIARVLFDIVIMVHDQDNQDYIIQGILGYKGEI
jgi:hypothetical protein